MGKFDGDENVTSLAVYNGIPDPSNLKPSTYTDINDVPVYKKTSNYSGLSNQGSTCYLNSLLQSLFMTPQFRINVLNWKYDEVSHGSKQDCIPYQLQKLFARLQRKLRSAEETKDLTKSFQWDSSEVYRQHDIQELCRVLFEAIEASLGPDDNNFILDLFEGISSSIVKCKECKFESERTENFLDISLPIRNDFDKIYNTSLEMALYNYLRPELLEKTNQYHCSKCDKKVDALKFVRLTKLPKILFIQLGRFEYDFVNDNRKKINDRVSFPTLLNLNNFNRSLEEMQQFFNEEYFKRDPQMEITPEDLEEAIKQGPHVYELYSVVIHSGNAHGGHYYAYSKSFEDNQWYSFNDSNVCEISIKDIINSFGGSTNATGYVLLYRQATLEKVNTIADSLISAELTKDIDEEHEKILEEEKKWRERLHNFTLKIQFDDVQKTVVLKKYDTIKTLKERMMKEFNIDALEENVRVRAYNLINNKPVEAYDEEDEVNYIFNSRH